MFNRKAHRLGRRLLAATMLVQAVPLLAAPRTAGDDPAPNNQGLISFAAPKGRAWLLEANIKSLYDSNILRRGNGVAPRTGDSDSDFRFTPTVRAALGLPVGRQQIFLGAELGRDFYVRNTRLNRNRYDIGGGVNWRLGQRCYGGLAAEYDRRQSILSDVSEVIDNVQKHQTYAASADCQGAVGIGFGGSVRRNVTDNENLMRATFDSRSTAYEGHASYGSPTLGRLSLGGTYTQVAYPRRLVVFAGPNNSFAQTNDGLDLYNARVGYQRTLGTRLQLNLGGSYIKAKPKPQTIQVPTPIGPFTVFIPNTRAGYSGLGYDVSLAYNSGSRLSGQLTATQNVTSTSNVGALFVIDRAYLAEVDYDLGASISTGLGASYQNRNYRQSFPSATELSARISDKITRFYGFVTYAPVKLYDIDLEVAHQIRSSNPDIYNYTSTSVSLTLRVKLGRG